MTGMAGEDFVRGRFSTMAGPQTPGSRDLVQRRPAIVTPPSTHVQSLAVSGRMKEISLEGSGLRSQYSPEMSRFDD